MRLYTLVKKQWEADIKASQKNKDSEKKSERKPKFPKNIMNSKQARGQIAPGSEQSQLKWSENCVCLWRTKNQTKSQMLNPYDSVKVRHSWAYVNSIAAAAQSEEKQTIKKSDENVFRWWEWFCKRDREFQDVKDFIVFARTCTKPAVFCLSISGCDSHTDYNIWASVEPLFTLIPSAISSFLNIPRHHFPICYSQESEAGVQILHHPVSSTGFSWELTLSISTQDVVHMFLHYGFSVIWTVCLDLWPFVTWFVKSWFLVALKVVLRVMTMNKTVLFV